jgi:L-aminopeptidase/D-esterase-like protein
MIGPGPKNLITDVAGILVGNAEDRAARTGSTVVLCETPAVAAVDVRGGAPLTVGASSLEPGGLVEAVDAVVLSGGSAFGLAATDGVRSWLAAQERGLAFGGAVVPIVVGAILFDLTNGGDKAWGDAPPYRALGSAAVARAAADFVLGNAGAGLGARAGALKGGLGSASLSFAQGGEPVTVGALAAANPVGSVVMPGQPAMWAWALEQAGELGVSARRWPGSTRRCSTTSSRGSRAPARRLRWSPPTPV